MVAGGPAKLGLGPPHGAKASLRLGRHPDDPGLAERVDKRPADPPGGVSGELDPAVRVEPVDGLDQADGPFLDEVVVRHPAPAVSLRQRVHQAQVGLDRGGPGVLDPHRDLPHATARSAGRAGSPTAFAALMNSPRAGAGSSRQNSAKSTLRSGCSGRATIASPATDEDVVSASASPDATSAKSAGPDPPRRSSGVTPTPASVSATARSYATPSRCPVPPTVAPRGSSTAPGPEPPASRCPRPASTSHGSPPTAVRDNCVELNIDGATSASRRPSC